MEARIRKALRARFGAACADSADLENLGGHASLRIYWRIESDTGRFPRNESTLMAMVLPQGDEAMASEEGGSSNDPEPGELPFVAVQRYLDRLGMPVPTIEYVDMELGVLLLEDLGDTMFENVYLDDEKPTEDLYREAIDLLIGFQCAVGDDLERDCICWQKSFDRELLRWELDHYREWGLDEHYGSQALDPHREELETVFDSIVDELLELPQTLVLRDYQSRNIMRKSQRWYLIDFQDALVGPYIYDLVALLRDSYIELQPEVVERLVGYYQRAGAEAGLTWCETDVHRAFHLQTLQRKLKDAGRFVFIDKVKGNSSFLHYYEPSIGYVKNAIDRLDGFAQLADILEDVERAY